MEDLGKLNVGGVDRKNLLDQLVKKNIQFNPYAKQLFDNTNFTPSEKIFQLNPVRVSFADLGLKSTCSYQKIIDCGFALDLDLCPLYLAAFLRLKLDLSFLEQPENPYLTVISPKLNELQNYPTGFYLRNTDGVFWLRGYRVEGVADWPEFNDFIFLKKNKEVGLSL